MREIELPAGDDTGGDKPRACVVLPHGLMMNASLQDGPIADLSAITGAGTDAAAWWASPPNALSLPR